MLKRAIDSGAITISRKQSPHLNLGKIKASMVLFSGDDVRVESERRIEPAVDFNYELLFEDDVLFVINKPANLPVHPAGRYFFNTLLTHLKAQSLGKAPPKDDEPYYLVHRIDKETSGILVLAKEKEACANLVKQFADRKTEKTYLAIARGITPENFEDPSPLGPDPHSQIRLKQAVVSEDKGGAHALTRFERISTHIRPGPGGKTPSLNPKHAFSVVKCFPKTGRQHQIRVHLEHSGHPIVGDKLYGLPEGFSKGFYEHGIDQFLTPERLAVLCIPRHALHAHELKFKHPTTGKEMHFKSDLPKDLQEFLKAVETGEWIPPPERLMMLVPDEKPRYLDPSDDPDYDPAADPESDDQTDRRLDPTLDLSELADE